MVNILVDKCGTVMVVRDGVFTPTYKKDYPDAMTFAMLLKDISEYMGVPCKIIEDNPKPVTDEELRHMITLYMSSL